jgi:hypothetical protein
MPVPPAPEPASRFEAPPNPPEPTIKSYSTPLSNVMRPVDDPPAPPGPAPVAPPPPPHIITFAVNVEIGVITQVPLADALKFKSPSALISHVDLLLNAGLIVKRIPPLLPPPLIA